MEVVRPKILLLSTGLGLGGAEKVILMLAKHLKSIGVTTFSFGLNHEADRIPEFHAEKLSAESVDMSKSVGGLIKQIKSLLSFTKEQNINLIHAHMAHAIIIACMMKLFRPSLKVIATMHSERPGGLFIKLMLFLTKSLRFRDIIFIEEHSTWYTSNRYTLIPNCPEPGLFEIEKEGPEYFLFLGRLSPEKNPLFLVDIIAKCSETSIKLLVAGDGPQKEELEALIISRGLQERIKCLGYTSDIEGLLGKAIALLIVSEFEGFPLNLLEAGASGTAVVSVDLAIAQALLKEDCGIISSVEKMHEALDELFQDIPRALQIGQNLKNRIQENYSQEVFIQKHLKLYAESGLDIKGKN